MTYRTGWFRRQKGQSIVEYVILVVVVALAAFFVLTMFSDSLREMITGATRAREAGQRSGTVSSAGEAVRESPDKIAPDKIAPDKIAPDKAAE